MLVLTAKGKGTCYEVVTEWDGKKVRKNIKKVLEFMEDGDDAAIEALVLAEKVEKFSATEFTPIFRHHGVSDLDTLRDIKQSWSSI